MDRVDHDGAPVPVPEGQGHDKAQKEDHGPAHVPEVKAAIHCVRELRAERRRSEYQAPVNERRESCRPDLRREKRQYKRRGDQQTGYVA